MLRRGPGNVAWAGLLRDNLRPHPQMHFPLGKPIVAMLAICAVSGAVIARHPKPPPRDLSLWTFADSHASDYRKLIPLFERASNQTVGVHLIATRALNVRLTSLFMSGENAAELADAAEIEISSIGRYFRPPAEEIGFLPLNSYLERSGLREIRTLDDPGKEGWNARLVTDGRIYTITAGRWIHNPGRTRPDAWIDRILKSRFAPWSKNGVIYGVPNDVHPVTLTYRSDLFRDAGVDIESAKTWPELQERCLEFGRYWERQGYPRRHALELPLSSADYLTVMLLQRHVNLVDDQERLHFTDPKVASTVAFYAGLVAGPRKVAAESSGGTGLWAGDIAAGNLCAFLTPDWRASYLRRYAAPVAGKLRMMPLPRFEPEDAPTSTWGGTMIGIPRMSKHHEQAWKLIEFLYLSEAALGARGGENGVVPPLPEAWDQPAFQREDPFFGGQRVMKLYTELAAQIPERYVTPVSALATATLSVVLTRATAYIEEHGTGGLEAACRQWLAQAQADVARRLEHARFEPIPQH